MFIKHSYIFIKFLTTSRLKILFKTFHNYQTFTFKLHNVTSQNSLKSKWVMSYQSLCKNEHVYAHNTLFINWFKNYSLNCVFNCICNAYSCSTHFLYNNYQLILICTVFENLNTLKF